MRTALRLSRKDGRPAFGIAVALGVGLWLVLLGLAMVGPGGGTARLRELLTDYGAAVRLLLAIPILLIDEIRVDRRIAIILPAISASHLFSPEEHPSWEARVRSARRRITGRLTLLVLGGVTVGLIVMALVRPPSGLSEGWMMSPSGPAGLSWAGLWYAVVARPIFLFLGLYWIWRWIAVSILVYRTSRSSLQPQVSHPDRVGGLAIFMGLMTAATAIIITASAVISAEIFYEMAHRGASLKMFAPVLLGYIALALVIALGPFLSFIPLLGRLRWRALYSFGVLASQHSALFENRWFRERPDNQELLGAPEISSLTDLATAYDVAASIRIIPFGRGAIVSVLVSAVLPMVPVVLLEVPLKEIVSKIVKFLL